MTGEIFSTIVDVNGKAYLMICYLLFLHFRVEEKREKVRKNTDFGLAKYVKIYQIYKI